MFDKFLLSYTWNILEYKEKRNDDSSRYSIINNYINYHPITNYIIKLIWIESI